MYAGDEFYPDDVTSGPATDDVLPVTHSPSQCSAARISGRDGGFHTGWGICSATASAGLAAARTPHRVTADELDHLAEWLNMILERPADEAYEIEWAYGRLRLVRNRGSVDVSPRLPKGQLAVWIRAYIAGIGAPRPVRS
jgi:hypothetical protein